MKHDYVTHTGIVTAVSPGQLTIVTDGGSSSCDGCAVASLCNKTQPSGTAAAAEAAGAAGHSHGAPAGEVLVIETPRAGEFSPGQRVKAVASSASTLTATWWALALPTLIFIGVAIGVRLVWPDSGAWALGASFAALALYDAGLYTQRRRLALKLRWQVDLLGAGDS